jgi:hypothetical protein
MKDNIQTDTGYVRFISRLLEYECFQYYMQHIISMPETTGAETQLYFVTYVNQLSTTVFTMR